MERRRRWKIGRVHVFSPLAYQNSISPIWEENKGKMNSCSQWLNYSSSSKMLNLLVFPPFVLFLCARLASFFFFAIFFWALGSLFCFSFAVVVVFFFLDLTACEFFFLYFFFTRNDFFKIKFGYCFFFLLLAIFHLFF